MLGDCIFIHRTNFTVVLFAFMFLRSLFVYGVKFLKAIQLFLINSTIRRTLDIRLFYNLMVYNFN